ncbi:MAG TPA: DUF58 domain-containing protein [Casimicrobiaceae bacterium]|nr:DUF58 domain-containing protein [Casimicrobiaceae bacterium]
MTFAAAAPRASRGTVASLWRRARQRAFRVDPADRAPVVLRHSRIYILPTRRGYAIIAMLLLMLLTSLNYALSLGLGVTFVLGGLVSAALLHTFRNLSGIEIKPLAAGDTFAGGHVVFSLSLAAGAIDRRSVVISANGSSVASDVTAGELHTITLPAQAPTRGGMPLGRVTLASDHPLGLWRGWAYVHFPLTGIVYPAPEASAPPLPTGEHGVDLRARGRGEDHDLAGLRDYQRGDPLQRVAWKAVARGAGWFSKAFEGTGGGGPIMLDWSRLPASLDTEQRLSRLAAWILAAERTTRPFGLSLPGTLLAPASGREHRRIALTALALFPEVPQ